MELEWDINGNEVTGPHTIENSFETMKKYTRKRSISDFSRSTNSSLGEHSSKDMKFDSIVTG